MKNNRITQISLLAVCMMLLSLLGGGISIAEEPGPDQGPLATMTIEAGVISWEPQVENGRLSLTIGGPGDFYLQQEHESGARLTFTPEDGAGNPLPDGVYKYELRFLPVMGKALSGYDESQRGIASLKGTEMAPVQSGSFSVLNGSFVTQDAVESAPERELEQPEERSKVMDQVILDDLIVDGSACIGFDCVNGESFGFDTLRLKENNTRIKFQDTSTSASFPSNDWQITANDSANGGANKFSIDDIDGGRTPFTIEAGARTNALYVEDGGRIGFGTSTPVVKGLHMKYNDTPTLRLEQDGSSGWTPQTWDVAGNEANFFIRDVTNGSKLIFKIKPGAPTSSIFIAADGDVGLGTESPAANLHVDGSGIVQTVVQSDTNDWTAFFASDAYGPAIHWEGSSANNLRFGPSTDINGTGFSEKMRITGAGDVGIGNTSPTHLLDVGTSGAYCDGGAWVDGSSREYKTNVEGLTSEEATAVVRDLTPIKFNYKTELEEQYLGFIAEDVPDLVATNDRKGLSSMDIVAVLTKVVQEQQRIIEELEARLAALEKAAGTTSSP
jgi:hypothetical protein